HQRERPKALSDILQPAGECSRLRRRVSVLDGGSPLPLDHRPAARRKTGRGLPQSRTSRFSRAALRKPGYRFDENVLDIKFEQQHVTIAHDVIAAFNAVMAGLARVADGTALRQVLPAHGLRLDESAFEIGVNRPGSPRGGVAAVNRPGA